MKRLYFPHALTVFISMAALFSFVACSGDGASKQQTTQPKGDSAITRANKTFLTDCRKLLAQAREMDSILLQQNEIDLPSARKAIVRFADYANYCHNDSLSPIYLIKCAQVARAIENIPQAKIVLEHCIRDYPNFKDRAAAIFLLAQLYDEVIYLNDEAEARRLYEQILIEYPSSEWARSAKGALTFLGKTDEDIMRSLKKDKKK